MPDWTVMSIRSHRLYSQSGFTITPSASAQPRKPNGIYVGTAGSVVVKFEAAGPDVTFTAVPAGTLLPIQPLIVSACSGCVGL